MTTPHGQVETPVFMPVGTQATVKALDWRDLEQLQAQIVLGNTYHLYLRPGEQLVAAQGGLHAFSGWEGPILTDSGGFQAFSLAKQMESESANSQKSSKNRSKATKKGQSLAKVTEEGVHFSSHLDGSKHFFSPERSIEIQRQLGADIIMAFDECTPDQAELDYARDALERTHRWAEASRNYWQAHDRLSQHGQYQALFGIVQGALYPELRRESAQQLVVLDFDGYAVGGETVGYNMPGTVQVLDWVEPLLPADKPRYAMGVGRDPQNLVDMVLAGVDMFDCVAPTRLARNGALYVGQLEFKSGQDPVFRSDYSRGRLSIGRRDFATDRQPIQTDCDCYTCRSGYSRAYLHHLYRTQELTYYRLASIHNVRTMVRIGEQLRAWILA